VDVQIKKDWLDIIKLKYQVTKMNNTNRDLLVLFKQALKNPQAIEREVSWLHGLLYAVEKIDNLAISHELIDLNQYKLEKNLLSVKKYLYRGKEMPFVFLNNKN